MDDIGVMFESKNECWQTPQVLFDRLNEEFNFDIDVAASESNAKCNRFFTEKENALLKEWNGTCWCNPPYGKKIPFFIRKAYEESNKGNTIVCLIPARTDTRYWHDYVMFADEVRLVKSRIKFDGGTTKNSAPFPSAIVVFRKNCRVSPLFSTFVQQKERVD